MRVLQLIDSLNPGGAERMAVNYANSLSKSIEYSGIVVSRTEGKLKNKVTNLNDYFFLNKKHTFDIRSILLFKKIIKDNKIDVIHSHGTSFFLAFLVKLVYFKVKVVQHEHYGNRANQSFLQNIPLLFCCCFYNKILVVNYQIEKWFHKYGYKNAVFIPNFAVLEDDNTEKTILKGEIGKRIICLANLKNPKNHQVLLTAFFRSGIKNQGWSVHLVGKNYNDYYYNELVAYAKENYIYDSIHFYDLKKDIKNILSQGTIGVLCSLNEGFPVTLLEYGVTNLPVVASNVGFCPEIIKHEKTGLLFNPENVDDLVLQLKELTTKESIRENFSKNLFQKIEMNYSESIVLKQIKDIYKNLLL